MRNFPFQFRSCPRNCKRRARTNLSHWGLTREGGNGRRAASQETCRRCDCGPGGVPRRRSACRLHPGAHRGAARVSLIDQPSCRSRGRGRRADDLCLHHLPPPRRARGRAASRRGAGRGGRMRGRGNGVDGAPRALPRQLQPRCERRACAATARGPTFSAGSIRPLAGADRGRAPACDAPLRPDAVARAAGAAQARAHRPHSPDRLRGGGE